jgi:hypothetical protein
MPIIIDEIAIQVNASDSQAPAGGQEAGPAMDSAEIVKKCVEKVLEILELKNER